MRRCKCSVVVLARASFLPDICLSSYLSLVFAYETCHAARRYELAPASRPACARVRRGIPACAAVRRACAAVRRPPKLAQRSPSPSQPTYGLLGRANDAAAAGMALMSRLVAQRRRPWRGWTDPHAAHTRAPHGPHTGITQARNAPHQPIVVRVTPPPASFPASAHPAPSSPVSRAQPCVGRLRR